MTDGIEGVPSTEPVAEPGSVKAYILGDIKAKRESVTERVPVPRFNGRVVLRCHSLADRDALRLSLEAEETEDKVEGLIQAAITALLSSCDGVETDQTGPDGKPVDLGVKLGLELSQYLGPDADCGTARSDREAVVEIFGGEADIVMAANELGSLQQIANVEIEKQVVGESGAAS
jgi:hypothetical protein